MDDKISPKIDTSITDLLEVIQNSLVDINNKILNISKDFLDLKDKIEELDSEESDKDKPSNPTINPNIELISITIPNNIILQANGSSFLSVKYNPSTTTFKEITWTSSDTSVATVSNSGVVIWKGEGTAIITATSSHDSEISSNCSVICRELPIEVENKTATQIVNDMTVGWNLGNSLDSTQATLRYSARTQSSNEGIDYETCWGNPITTEEMIKMVHDKGFNSIRIPITWNHHLITTSTNDITISPNFLSRVKQVVDYAYDLGMYVIINTHHDASDYSNGKTVSEEEMKRFKWLETMTVPYQLFHCQSGVNSSVKSSETIEVVCDRARRLWKQIALAFKDYDYHLLFEGFNEMLGSYPKGRGESFIQPTFKQQDNLNKINQAFVDSVRATGGNNATRSLIYQTYGGIEGGFAVSGVKVTDTTTDGIILQIHYYTDDTSETLSNVLESASKSKYPCIIGEAGWSIFTSHVGDKEYELARNYVARAKDLGIKIFWWDNNAFGDNNGQFGLLKRRDLTWGRERTAQGLIDGVTQGIIEKNWTTEYIVRSSDVVNGGIITRTDISNEKDIVGNIVPATSYGRVVLTIKIDGKENDEINILAGNLSYDEVGDANAFKLKRIVWLDENKKAIESSTEEYNSYGAVIPFKARYARFGFVQVYTESVTSDNIKSAMNSNKVWIKIKSEAIITIDKSNFEAIPSDEIVVDGSYMHMDNFKTGNIYVEGEQGVVGTINTDNTGYGSIAAEFIGFTQGDTLKVKCTSPGYGNSDTCMRINRWCWFDDSWTKVGEAQRIGVNPPYEQAFTAPAGATKLRLSICNPWSRELTSQKCLSYVDSHDILIKTIRSNNNIQPVLGTKLS